MQSQNLMIINYLLKADGITQKEATDLFGITRLPARISDLKKQGYHIKDDYETAVNRFGRQTRFKRYRLEVRA